MSLQNISASFSVSEEERTRKLLENLRVWCDQEYGRRVQIARLAGVTPQAVSNWFAGRHQPTAEAALVLLEFMEARARTAK
jgi:transcriptional regulator with XRE-family HTH domain